MDRDDGLFLYEEMMLLALRDKEGTIAADEMGFSYALAASLLADLLFLERVGLEQVKKKRMVNVENPTPIRDPLLEECLERLRSAKRRAHLATWVTRLARLKKLKHRAALQLCRRGILRLDEGKVLLLFRRKIFPELDPGPERELVERLRRAIFTDDPDVDPRTCVLVSLADKGGVLRNVFDKRALKGRRSRLERIAEGEVLSATVKEVVRSMQAALAAAAVGSAASAAVT